MSSSFLLNISSPLIRNTNMRFLWLCSALCVPCARHIKVRSDLLSPQVKSWESAYRLRCDQRQKSLLQPHQLEHMMGRFDLQSDVELPDLSCEICYMTPFIRLARCFDT